MYIGIFISPFFLLEKMIAEIIAWECPGMFNNKIILKY